MHPFLSLFFFDILQPGRILLDVFFVCKSTFVLWSGGRVPFLVLLDFVFAQLTGQVFLKFDFTYLCLRLKLLRNFKLDIVNFLA